MLALPLGSADPEALLEALLPLDATRRTEQQTYLEFVAAGIRPRS